MTRYPPPQLLRRLEQQLTTRMGMDPDAAAALFPEVVARRERRKRGEPRGDMMTPERRQRSRRREGGETPAMLNGPRRIVAELSMAKLARAIYGERQLQEVMTDFWFNHFNVFAGKNTNRWLVAGYERDAIRPHVLGRFRDLLGATAQHPAMLLYLDNWQSADPQASQNARRAQAAYGNAARAAGLSTGGVAAEILQARGMEPAEIERLLVRQRGIPNRRNRQRMTPRRGQSRQRAARRPPQPNRQRTTRRRPKRGLNENYARELLELHTLGVDGGYTQQDVIEVARCFTGWSITPLQFGQQFVYLEEYHDPGKKVVLNHQLENGGQQDGKRVLDQLARHPSTAQFISLKLARRFVSDHPPASLVDAMAKTFLETDGDIRQVLRTLFGSREFWSVETVNAKYKTPLTFVVSAARATGLEFDTVDRAGPGSFLGLVLLLHELGQPLYGARPPTGFGESEEAWLSAGGMLHRLKIASSFASGRTRGMLPGEDALWIEASDADSMLTEAELTLLGRPLSPRVREAALRELVRLERYLRIGRRYARLEMVPAPLGPLVASWILASPDFQRH